MTFFCYIVAGVLAASSLFASGPEKYLCWYYFPDYHEPADAFKKECEMWCDSVKAGKISTIPKPKAGATCKAVPVSHKEEDWQTRMADCRNGSYTFCQYEGHSGGFSLEGTSARNIARACLSSPSCLGFRSDSCFGSSPNEVEEFLAQLRGDVKAGRISLAPGAGPKSVGLHQTFIRATFNPLAESYETRVTYYVYNEDGQCKVDAIYPRCSTASPISATNPEGTSNLCYSPYQNYFCQMPGANGKFVSDPLEAEKQNVAQEVCCVDTITKKRGFRLCTKDASDPLNPKFDCACPIPKCDAVQGTECTGYGSVDISSRSDDSRRPPSIPACSTKGADGKESVRQLCCKDPGAEREIPYGPTMGVWAPRNQCPELAAKDAEREKAARERDGSPRDLPPSAAARSSYDELRRHIDRTSPGSDRPVPSQRPLGATHDD